MLVILDAGHGPETRGKETPLDILTANAGMPHVNEFRANVIVANNIAFRLLKQGHNVVTLWSNDIDVPLRERVAAANAAAQKEGQIKSVLVSIHHNAFERDTSVRGMEVHIAPNASTTSEKLAKEVVKRAQQNYVAVRSFPIKRSSFTILTATTMPAILIECGYFTNPWDCWLINTKYWGLMFAEIVSKSIATL